MDPNEYKIYQTGKTLGKSDAFIKGAIQAYRASKGTSPSSLADQAWQSAAQTPQTPPAQTGSAGQAIVPGSTLGSNLKALPGAILNAGKSLFNTITGSEQKAGADITAALPGNSGILGTGVDALTKANQQKDQSDTNFIQAMNARRKAGQPLTAVQQQLYDSILSHHQETTAADLTPAVTKSTGQVLGDFAGVAADVAGAGSFGAKASGAKFLPEAGDLLGKTGTLTEKTALPSLISGPPEATANAIKNALPKSGSAAEKATDILKATEDTLPKAQRVQAFEDGRVVATKLGGKSYTATESEQRAGEILAGKLTSNPVKNVPIIKQQISTLGKLAEEHLAANAKPVSAAEQGQIFDALRSKASKYLTDTELKAYDEQIALFERQLPGRGGYNTANFYKALKDYENNVADRLARGKSALLDPTGVASAKLHAASDVRSAVRDLIATKNKEFKSRMFDLASLYDAKTTMITKADQLEGNIFTRAASTKVGKAAIGAASLLGADKLIKGATGLGY